MLILLSVLIDLRFFFVFFFFETGSPYVAQADLKLVILLPQASAFCMLELQASTTTPGLDFVYS
jgi:hypothetical protein